jgi:hypothetical protein
MLDSCVVAVAFQSIFYLEMHQIIIFLIIFDISVSK